MLTPDHSLMALAGELSKHLPLFLNIILAIPLLIAAFVVIVGSIGGGIIWAIMTPFGWDEEVRQIYPFIAGTVWGLGNIWGYETACAGALDPNMWLHLNLAFLTVSALKFGILWLTNPDRAKRKSTPATDRSVLDYQTFKSIK